MRSFQYRPLATSLCLFAISASGTRAAAQSGFGVPVAQGAADRIQRDIDFLASDSLEGRRTGTHGNDQAAAFIVQRDVALGLLSPWVDSSGAECRTAVPMRCGRFVQRFIAHGVELARMGIPEGVPAQNVVAMIPGRDASLRGQYVVIGAHYDHLGRSTADALDPERGAVVRNGADDNASGTAAVLELARRFAAMPARRSIIVANFGGEEMGLLGSQYFVAHSPVSLDSIVAMVNFDMVGRLRDDKLIVYGVATATEFAALIDSANTASGLVIHTVGDGFGPSDHATFFAKGIPVLHFFTDIHEDYHRASDRAGRINADGEARVVALAERVIQAVADRQARPTVVRAKTARPR